ncbi:MAG: ABC transporter permease [Caldilineaceae bacterium]|nr:ABC transporter permease [Caldilineaceae bacterium]
MATTTATAAQRETPRKSTWNRWDSPWLNPKFIAGLSMVLFVALMGVIGPFFWNTDLARVASSPQNLPPPWAGYDFIVAENVPVVNPNATPGRAPANSNAATNSTPASVATPRSHSITGGNPFATAAATSASTRSGSLTGGNPFAQATPASNAATTGTAADTTAAPTVAPQATPRPVSNNPFGFGMPSWEHPLGTESNGRDMLAVLIVGAPRSLRVGLIAAGIGMLVGVFLGFSAGFLGGWVDHVIRTLSDAVITIPSLAVLIVISAYVRSVSVENMALLLALFAWPGPTRLIRAQVLTMRERGYVQMARLSGASPFDIMFREMMPNLLPYLASSFTGNVSGAILAATGLEALGLGPTRIPTLGMTIFYAIRAAAILREMWWWWGLPIAILVIIFSGLFLMTVGLDEIANPRLRGAKAQ